MSSLPSTALWRGPTLERPLANYVWLFAAIPLGLVGITGASRMFGIGLLVTAGVTATLVVAYQHVVPRLPEPRSGLGVVAVHVATGGLGTAVGALPGAALWSWVNGFPLEIVYPNVLRIAWTISALVMVGVIVVDRVSVRTTATPAAPPVGAPERLTARRGRSVHVFDPSGVTRLYATDKYVALRVDDREYLLDESLTALERRLESWGFLRTHRGELVNRHHVRSFDGSVIELADGQQARVSRRAAPRVRQLLR